MVEAFYRKSFLKREDWLAERNRHLQASDAASIDGSSPWKSAAELYDEKMGIFPSEDISGKPYVKYGIKMEPVAREAFMLDVPYFSLEYNQYDILESKKRSYMGATLDGELTVTSPMNPWGFPVGTKGVYEGKTGGWTKQSHLYSWDGTENYIPPYYYVQGLHQLSVTGWDFVIFGARLKRDPFRDEDQGFPEIRTFYRIIDRRSRAVQEDIRLLEDEEEAFWEKHILAHRRPARRIAI